MELVCQIKGRKYNIVVGATFSEEYNETLDSGAIIIPQVKKIDLNPYDDVYIWNKDEDFNGYYNKGDTIPSGIATSNSPLPKFFKHLLVDTYRAEMIGLDGKYNYTINLMSETKGLDVVVCPNISITQSLKDSEKRTCLFYLEQYINLYSPKIKVKDILTNTWTYKNKYKLDPNDENTSGSVAQIFKNVLCPEMSFTNPTLRDVLSQIMTVCDCIPVVKNNVIYAMQISKTNGTFKTDNEHTNYIHEGANSSDFTTGARREYSGALSQTTTQCVEYLGFRNPSDALMTLENMYVETRFPIYKINKMYLCYYKGGAVVSQDGTLSDAYFLCEQNITDLVLQNNVRNALSANWEEYPQEINERSDMSKYKVLTVGYDIGSNKITGWGTKYTYATWAWFTNTATYIENILTLLEQFNPFGETTSFSRIALRQQNYAAVMTNQWENAMVSPLTGSAKLKTIFFRIDYESMYDGAIVHGKENAMRDDIVTVDNQSSALTIAEKDGLFEYSKLKRLGNTNVQIQCRYESVEQMNNDYNNVLGAIYKNNIIIFHKEYQIYDSFVLCNFVGTYSYVLQNYFTSVFAKLRMYNYMSYGESIKRAENFKKYLMLSLDKSYFEFNNDFLVDKKSLLTAVTETTYNVGLYTFENKYELNTGYFYVNGSKYLSDMQRLISGYSLCFNVKMYDNIAGGLYIKDWQAYYQFKKADGTLQNVDIKIPSQSQYDTIDEDGTRKAIMLEGTNQAWYIMPTSLTDAFIENIGIYIGVNDSIKDINFTNPETREYALSNYTNIINKLPKTTNAITNALGNTYNICKDNKELIDATFQIELLNNNPLNLEQNNENGSLVVSNWFMKLCDLYGNYIKSSDKKEYKNYSAQLGTIVTFITGWREVNNRGSGYPVFTLRIHEEDIDFVKENYVFWVLDYIKNTVMFVLDSGYGANVYKLFLYPLSIVDVSNDKTQITVKFHTIMVNDERYPSTPTYYDEFDFEVVMKKDSESLDGYYDYLFYGDLGGDPYYIRQFYYMYWIAYNVNQYPSQFPEHSKNANISNAVFYENIGINEGEGEPFIIDKPRNMFVSYSTGIIDNNIIQKTFNFNNFSNSGCILTSDINVQSVLRIYGNHTICFYLNKFSSSAKSVQYWFYDDEGDKLLHFVLGVNLTDEMKTRGYVDIYSSLIISKDERVFDYLYNEDYRIKNYIGDSSYGTEQGCVKFVYALDGIEYVKVGEEHITRRNIYYHKVNETELNELTEYYVI